MSNKCHKIAFLGRSGDSISTVKPTAPLSIRIPVNQFCNKTVVYSFLEAQICLSFKQAIVNLTEQEQYLHLKQQSQINRDYIQNVSTIPKFYLYTQQNYDQVFQFSLKFDQIVRKFGNLNSSCCFRANNQIIRFTPQVLTLTFHVNL